MMFTPIQEALIPILVLSICAAIFSLFYLLFTKKRRYSLEARLLACLTLADIIGLVGWLLKVFHNHCFFAFLNAVGLLGAAIWTCIVSFHMWRIVTMKRIPNPWVYYITGLLLPTALVGVSFATNQIKNAGANSVTARCWYTAVGGIYLWSLPKGIAVIWIIIFFALVVKNLPKIEPQFTGRRKVIGDSTKYRMILMMICFLIPNIFGVLQLHPSLFTASAFITAGQGVGNTFAALFPILWRKLREIFGNSKEAPSKSVSATEPLPPTEDELSVKPEIN